jgi:hypothetical protein
VTGFFAISENGRRLYTNWTAVVARLRGKSPRRPNGGLRNYSVLHQSAQVSA